MSAQRILIINGPNLNLLGKREPEIYGSKSFEEFFVELKSSFANLELSYFQSNLEGEIINQIQGSDSDGIVLNAGGFTHSSVAIRDVITLVDIPVVEVHISNITQRESFRHESLLSPVCNGCIFGFGLKGYALAINALEL
jgi:3-dehydroquinate dehydratase II